MPAPPTYPGVYIKALPRGVQKHKNKDKSATSVTHDQDFEPSANEKWTNEKWTNKQ